MRKTINKLIIPVLAGLSITSLSNFKGKAADYTSVSVPISDGSRSYQKLLTGDDSGYIISSANFNLNVFIDFDKTISGQLFSSGSIIESDEYLFVALIDRSKDEVVAFAKINGQSFGNIKAPYYSDMVELHIYKQKKSEPDFTLKSENFIGKTKVLLEHDYAFYTYGIEETNHVPILNKDGNVIQEYSDKSTSLVRYTPNYFSMQSTDYFIDFFSNYGNNFLVIKLPEDKKDLIAEKDKIVPITVYEPYFPQNNVYGVLWECNCANFYIPDGIDKFELWCYNQSISDENFKWKCKIDLNRIY